MKETAFHLHWPVLEAGFQNSTLSCKEASLLVMNNIHGMLKISLRYAYITHLSVTESKVVQGRIHYNGLPRV